MLVTRFKRLAAALEEHGFKPAGPLTVVRRLPYIIQHINIQPGVTWKSNQFTCNFGWKLTVDGEETIGYAYNERLGFLMSEGDTWFGHASREEADEAFARGAECIQAHVIPFLDYFDNIQAMVKAYEAAEKGNLGKLKVAGGTDPKFYFGLGRWTNWYLACAYRALDRPAKAKRYFEAVVKSTKDSLDIPHVRELYEKSLVILEEFSR